MSLLTKSFYDYTALYAKGMDGLDKFSLGVAVTKIQVAERIFVGGNGGSAAISNHLCCDFMKGGGLEVMSLSCNTPLITAIANDLGYERSISFQLERLLNPGDIVLLISSSGNSPNIIEAAKVAKSRGAWIIGLTGFSGGKLKELADTSLHIPIDNYGIVEDCHQSIMHIISQYIAKQKAV